MGVDPARLQKLIDWCKIAWPQVDWDNIPLIDSTQANSASRTSNGKLAAGIKNEFQVYPNPVDDGVINVSTGLKDLEAHVFLYTLQGSPVMETITNQRSFNLDVSRVPSGMYILQVDNGEDRYMVRLILR